MDCDAKRCLGWADGDVRNAPAHKCCSDDDSMNDYSRSVTWRPNITRNAEALAKRAVLRLGGNDGAVGGCDFGYHESLQKQTNTIPTHDHESKYQNHLHHFYHQLQSTNHLISPLRQSSRRHAVGSPRHKCSLARKPPARVRWRLTAGV